MRVSESGLGCGPAGSGLNGWPFCNGDVVPGLDLNSVIEYTHRALAGVVGLMMIALAVLAWRRYRRHTGPRARVDRRRRARDRPGPARRRDGREGPRRGAGGRAPRAGDAAARVAALHLARVGSPAVDSPAVDGRRRPAVRSSLVSSAASCSARSWPAATWRARRTTAAPTIRSATAPTTRAARSSPPATATSCPSAMTRLVDIHLTHRVFMYLATIAVVSLIVMVLRRRPSPGRGAQRADRRRDPASPRSWWAP